MIDLLDKTWAAMKERPADAIGCVLTTGFVTASTVIGLSFAVEEGRTMPLAITVALVCVILCGELFKSLYIPLTWRRGRILSALIGLPLFALCIVYSWTANKQTMERNFGRHEFATVVESAAYKSARADVDDLKKRLKPIEETRPAGTVRADLEGKLATPGVGGCAGEMDSWKKREVCPDVAKLRAELAGAEERDRLEAQLAKARAKLAALEDPSAKADGFAATALAALASIGLQFNSMTEVLAFVIAVLVEGGSSLAPMVLISGGFLATPSQRLAGASEAGAPIGGDVGLCDHGDERINQTVAFFETRCERRHGAALKATTAWQAYLKWCEEAGQEPLVRQNQFWQLAASKLNLAKREISSAEGRGMHYLNLALKRPPEGMGAKIVQLYRTPRRRLAAAS